jgi:hypothetical protein
MSDVWSHIKKGQKIGIFASGHPMQLPNGKTQLKCESTGALAKKVPLISLINRGRVINKFGRIQPRKDENAKWATKAFNFHDELYNFFEAQFGYRLFAFFGTMLGFARDGGYMKHDHDLDLAYLSRQTSAAAVRDEFFEISRTLIERFPTGTPQKHKFSFKRFGSSLTPSWFEEGQYLNTFGYAGSDFAVSERDIEPLQSAEHMGWKFLLPANPKAVSARIYGKGWKYPDPGWIWLQEYTQRPQILASHLTEDQISEVRGMMAPVDTSRQLK